MDFTQTFGIICCYSGPQNKIHCTTDNATGKNGVPCRVIKCNAVP